MTKKVWPPYDETVKIVKKLGIQTNGEYSELIKSKKYPNLPSRPSDVYKHRGWINWRVFLGNTFCDFQEARKFVHSLKLKKYDEWKKFCREKNDRKDIPSNPHVVYKNQGWINWEDWLGHDGKYTKNKVWVEFDIARKFVRKLGLNSQSEWKEYCKSGKLAKNIPVYPEDHYKGKGWLSWGDWLGHDRVADQLKVYSNFYESRKFVRKLGLNSQSEWKEYCKSGKKPENIPAGPYNTYKKEWKNWGDWLGHDRVADQIKSENYLSWKEAVPIYRKLAQEYGLKNGSDWRKFSKKNKKLLEKLKIPQLPDRVYSKERVWRKMK